MTEGETEMDGFKIAFPTALEQAELLRAAGESAQGSLQPLRAAAQRLEREDGALQTLALALRRTETAVGRTGTQLAALGGRLEQIIGVYQAAEQRMLGRLDAQGAASGDVTQAHDPGNTIWDALGSAAAGAAAALAIGAPFGGLAGALIGGLGAPGTLDAFGRAADWLTQEHDGFALGSGSLTHASGLAGVTGKVTAFHYAPTLQLNDGNTHSKDIRRWEVGDAWDVLHTSGITLGGTGSLLHAEGKGFLGGTGEQLYVEACGDVGVVTASATAGVFSEADGTTYAGVQAGAGIYAVQGKVTGGLDLGFIKIGGSLTGQVGLGAAANAGFEGSTFSAGAYAALGAGGGGSIFIDFSPTVNFIKGLFSK